MAERTDELWEQDDDAPLRWYAVTLFVLVVVAGFAVGLWCLAGWVQGCTNKKLGSAVARDSPRGALCHSAHGAAVLVIPAGWLLGLGLACVALLRWGGGVLRAVLCGALLLTPVALPAAAYGGLRLSSTSCSDDELDAYRAWSDQGGRGTPPYDCRTF
ncbi:hypothetical protein G5V58_19870 [Nocardioides anomalus]|uniref:Uncharacterized protein n=1 Tax=Nocardioides anomalus TaxID=2712223 RepID=A0A6G6WHD3_9ACTN|nr:hypothetical protein [Nocardioides anomalus]QIG44738.1 hypothetical protein G5V58_19870 [Nocardioides anomalus]